MNKTTVSGMLTNIREQGAVLGKLAAACPEAAEALQQKLCTGGRLYILATGASLNAALASVPAFARFGGFVPAVIPASEASYYLDVLQGSSVLLISQSGGSFETKQLCDWLQERGIPFFGMTNEPESPLALAATEVILMDAEPEVSSATKTETASVFLLFMAALGAEADRDTMQALARAAAETVMISAPQAEAVARALQGCSVLYVLGDSINGPAAREAALMFKEKCLIHAEGMTASEFRHGAVEVEEEGLPVLLLAPTDTGYAEMRKHAAFLQERGFTIWLVSHRSMPEVSEERRIPIVVSGDDTLRHISTVIPAQLITEQLARLMGLDPDGFRFLTKVLSSY